MKSDDESSTSRYRMKARAKATAATREGILEAAISNFGVRLYDEVSLNDVADDAGVSVQTVLRHFGSKEDLVAAAVAVASQRVREERMKAPVGNVEAAVNNLVVHYEQWGDRVLLFLAQEQRVDAIASLTESGRKLHYAWVEQVFAPWIAASEGAAAERLRARLIASTDVYVWKIMRRDLGLDVAATETAIRELVAAIVHGEPR